MALKTIALLVICGAVGISLGGCRKVGDWWGSDARVAHGRYAGVGIYSPTPSWLKLVEESSAADTASAKLMDDQAIIVVVDSQTGEVRACGDLSGHCVGMNPWQAALAKSQVAPVRLIDHMATQFGIPQTNDTADAKTVARSE